MRHTSRARSRITVLHGRMLSSCSQRPVPPRAGSSLIANHAMEIDSVTVMSCKQQDAAGVLVIFRILLSRRDTVLNSFTTFQTLHFFDHLVLHNSRSLDYQTFDFTTNIFGFFYKAQFIRSNCLYYYHHFLALTAFLCSDVSLNTIQYFICTMSNCCWCYLASIQGGAIRQEYDAN